MFGIPVASDARRGGPVVNLEIAVTYSFSRTRTSANHGSDVGTDCRGVCKYDNLGRMYRNSDITRDRGGGGYHVLREVQYGDAGIK